MKYIRVSHLPYQTAKTAVPVYCGFVKMSLEFKEKSMDFKDIELHDLQDCPYCGGPAWLEHVGGWCCYVECADCGAQTPHMEYSDEKSKKAAEEGSVNAWNQGKVVNFGRGE